MASALMRPAEAWAKHAGARAVLLESYVTNADACALFTAFGYRRVAVMLLKEI